MFSYKNGNYRVSIFGDGTKIRVTEDDEFIPAFSENCDVKITDNCNMGCAFCFPAGTSVVTDPHAEWDYSDVYNPKLVGPQIANIEDIKEGDVVWSFNERFNGDEPAVVNQIFKREYKGDLVVIRVGDSIMKCTPNHKIYVAYGSGNKAEWIEAHDIDMSNARTPVVKTSLGWCSITSISLEPYEGYVYNIGVEHNHNYYAGTGGVLVHNCYEGCTPKGKHADLSKYDKLIESLHPYTEMALNGNDLNIPGFDEFLAKLKSKKVFANITVHQKQFMQNYNYIKKLQENGLIHGIGVSLADSNDKNFVEKLTSIPNTVLHTINGIFTENDYNNLKDHNIKILFLGYKHLKRGDSFYNVNKKLIDGRIEWLADNIMEITKCFKVASFDNLSLAQLDIKSKMDPAKWEEFYMGDDGGFTFYIDLVAGQFSKNSISQTRYEIGDKSIDDMFKIIQEHEAA